MRVLLLGGNQSPQMGGAYTFAQEVFEALATGAARSSHRFFVYDFESPSSKTPPYLDHFVRLADTRTLARRICERAQFGFRSLAGRLPGGMPAEHPFVTALRDDLRRCRVDCALGLTPWSSSPDLPNILPVWDLEHRRKPYFPEVAADGEWERRERSYRAMLPSAIAVYTGTETGKRQIERFYGLEPGIVKVIPFPTPSFALQAAANDDPGGLPQGVGGQYLFYPAQYWPHKNHVRLLQALRLLRERHDWDIGLVCCGSNRGGHLAYLRRRAADWGVEPFVRWLEFVSITELVALYRGAFALPFVSYFGPDNLPPLEAGALGCPVITSAVEGADEALGDAALYVNPDSAEDVAGALWRLNCEPGLRSRLCEAGRTRAGRFSARDYATSLLGILDELEVRFECFRS